MIEKRLDADGLGIRYLEAGAGAAVVVLHGGEGAGWSPIHERLAAGHRVIAPEIPGFGGAPGAAASMRERARTINSFAAKLGLEHYRIVTTGVSARIAMWAAIEAPDRIDALAMIAPMAILPDDWSPPPAASETLPKLIGPRRDSELENRLGELKMPVLVVFGTRDTVVPPAVGRIYRERIPNCYYQLIYDAGHAIAAERPDALARLVADFMERGDAFIVNRASGLINP